MITLISRGASAVPARGGAVHCGGGAAQPTTTSASSDDGDQPASGCRPAAVSSGGTSPGTVSRGRASCRRALLVPDPLREGRDSHRDGLTPASAARHSSGVPTADEEPRASRPDRHAVRCRSGARIVRRDPTPAVRLEGVRKRFGDVEAVAGIDLDIADGEFFSMLGPSGSGKTTTLRMIAGFELPTAGRDPARTARTSRSCRRSSATSTRSSRTTRCSRT